MGLQTLLSVYLFVCLSSPHLLPHPKVIRELRGDHLKDRNVLFDHLAKPVPAMDQSDAVIVMQETLKQHTSELVDCREELRVVNHRLDKVETEQSRQAAVLETGSAVGQSDPPAGKDVQQQLHVIQQQVQKLMERLQLLEERRNYDLPPLSQEGEDKFGGGGMSVHAKLKFLEEKILDVEKTANILSVHHSELELQLQASLASSFNGTFVWRIPDVPRRIREAKSGRVSSIYSPPFYTGRTGYKMCIRAYLNGDGIGENSHLSLFFVIMKGEYDPLLGWPFDHKVGEAPLQAHLLVGRVTSCYPQTGSPHHTLPTQFLVTPCPFSADLLGTRVESKVQMPGTVVAQPLDE